MTPYMVQISDAVRDTRTRWVVAMMGAQMGKTEGCFNELCRKLDDDPEPVLYVGPTQKNVQEKIEPRVVQAINSARSLSSKMLRGKRSTKTCKRIAGVTLNLAWAGSATELASQPAAMVLIDELDRMADIKGEGSVIELTAARMATYPDSKGIIDSTPTVGSVESAVDPDSGLEHWRPAPPQDVESPVWQQWQEGSREEWAVPCPDCDDYFVPRFKLLTWPEGSTPVSVLRDARLACPNCGTLIPDAERRAMNDRGLFVGPGQKVVDGRVVGELLTPNVRSFWVSGLMSPFVSFGERAADWLRAVDSRDQGRIQGVINTRFGELFQVAGEAPEWSAVLECAGEYKSGTVPAGVQKVFVTVDVQGDRLIYAVRGWGYAFESWGIEVGELWGDTKDPGGPVYDQLQTVLDRDFAGLPVAALAIDSGFNTPAVDAFAKRNKGRVFATVGRDNPARLFKPTPQEITTRGKTIKTGLDRWTVDHGHFKSLVHERLAWPADAVGAWHIPNDYSDDYARQVVAEHKIRLASGRTKWLKVRRDNHYLDCEYLQFFLAHLHRVGDLKPGDRPKAKKTRRRRPPNAGGQWVRGADKWIR